MKVYGLSFFMLPRRIFLYAICALLLLESCSRSSRGNGLAPLPTEDLPTLIALTVGAKRSSTLPVQGSTIQTAEPSASSPGTQPDYLLTTTPTWAITSTSTAPTPTLSGHTKTLPSPSFTPTPPRAVKSATATPTRTIPDAAIQIRAPGPMSRVVSPLQIRATVKPGNNGRIHLELLGEDERLLVRKVVLYGTTGGWAYLSENLDFEIPGVAETARLQISTYDGYGRIISLASTDLILLAMGEADVNPPGIISETIIVDEPLPNKLIQGGGLWVSGRAIVAGKSPLLIELVSAAGNIVGYRQADVTPGAEEGGYGEFRVEVPYKVDGPTWVRLVVKEMSDGRIGGVLHLTSLEIMLSP